MAALFLQSLATSGPQDSVVASSAKKGPRPAPQPWWPRREALRLLGCDYLVTHTCLMAEGSWRKDLIGDILMAGFGLALLLIGIEANDKSTVCFGLAFLMATAIQAVVYAMKRRAA